MIEFARYNDDGSISAGPIEGRTWSVITPASRFWPVIEAWVAAGNEIAPYEAPPLTLDDYRRAIETHVEDVARARDYGSAVSCASYVASANPVWQAEALAFVHWRDAVWVYVYAEFARVQAGERERPTIEALIAELPAMVWPE